MHAIKCKHFINFLPAAPQRAFCDAVVRFIYYNNKKLQAAQSVYQGGSLAFSLSASEKRI